MSKIIYIDGQAPNASGYSQLKMSPSDKAAARGFGMTSCLSADGFYRQSGELKLRNVASGEDCTISGTVVAEPDSAFNSKGVVKFNSGSRIDMPAGSGNILSFTFVIAFMISSSVTDDAIVITRYLSDGLRNGDLLVYAHEANVSNPGLYVLPFGNNITATEGGYIPESDAPLDQTHVLSASYDVFTGNLILRLNGVEKVNKILSGSLIEGEDARIVHGVTGSRGLVGSIARSYIYREALLSTLAGEADVKNIESALMAEYGIS